jgi:hypothetical protein
MELEEMKTLWSEMSEEVEKQKCLTDKLIIDMTQERYKNRFDKILLFESIGTVVCFIIAVFLVANLGKLDNWYLLTFGIFTIFFLILLPILTLRSIYRIKGLNIAKNSYKETIVGFAKAKKELLFTQRLGIYLSFVLSIVIMPVASKILNGIDFFTIEHSAWFWLFLPILFIFLFFFSRWGYRCYKSITNSAENVLKELEN